MLNYYLPLLIEWFNKLLSEMEFNKKDMLFIVRNNNLILMWVHFNECCSSSAIWKCGINKSILNAAINYLINVIR